MTDSTPKPLRSKPIPVPLGGFCTHEDEAKWLADTIAMRMADAIVSLGFPSVRVPTDSLYALLLIGLQSAAKRAVREERKRDDRISELLAANNREVERRRAAEAALRTVLARITDTVAEGWLARVDGDYPGTLAEYIRSVIGNEHGKGGL